MNEKEWKAELEIVSLKDCQLRDVTGGTGEYAGSLLHIDDGCDGSSIRAGRGEDLLSLQGSFGILHSIQG